MADYLLYHNPRCSKSRAALALLTERGITPQVVEYLQTPPDRTTLQALVQRLGLSHPLQMVRTGEADFADRGLSADSSADAVLDALAACPRLLERPILVRGERAVIGRPPERLLALLD